MCHPQREQQAPGLAQEAADLAALQAVREAAEAAVRGAEAAAEEARVELTAAKNAGAGEVTPSWSICHNSSYV